MPLRSLVDHYEPVMLAILIRTNHLARIVVRKNALRRGRRKNPEIIGNAINEGIYAGELRIIDDEKGNLGVMSRDEAIALAKKAGLDLIEISPDANPPVAKIMDYGEFQYLEKKKKKEQKQRTKTVEVKSVQVKIGTGGNDMKLKATRASEWLLEGNRVKAELYLRGRAKYMEEGFLRERLERFLELFTTPYRAVESIKKSPKGISVLLELDKSKKAPSIKDTPSITTEEPIGEEQETETSHQSTI